MAKTTESTSKSFLFRDLDSNILIGMAATGMPGGSGRTVRNAWRMAHKVQFNLIINNRAGGNAPPDRPEDR